MNQSKNILLSGASGLVGKALQKELVNLGYSVYKLVRHKPSHNEFQWNAVDSIEIPLDFPIHSVIHLSGENVAAGRWNKKLKQRIYDSRILSTRLLVSEMKSMMNAPKTFICASAVGIYGNRGDEVLTENKTDNVSYKGFLVSVAHDWEREARKYSESKPGTRTLNARIGVVLSPEGGALEKMWPVFKMRMGGPLGNRQQYMSWISISDLVRAFVYCLENKDISGPVNFCSPEPLRNSEFTKILGSFLNRPTLVPAPVFGLKLALGEMAEELLLSSTRAVPEMLVKHGFEFEHNSLESALLTEIGES